MNSRNQMSPSPDTSAAELRASVLADVYAFLVGRARARREKERERLLKQVVEIEELVNQVVYEIGRIDNET